MELGHVSLIMVSLDFLMFIFFYRTQPGAASEERLCTVEIVGWGTSDLGFEMTRTNQH